MKVLELNVVCFGSTGRIMRGIARQVRAHGGEAMLCYGRNGGCGDENAVRVEPPSTVYAHLLLARLTDRQGFYSVGATKKLVERIRAYDPDVIHLHNLHGYWLDMETLFTYLQESGKPVVWTLHDAWPFTGHCAYFDAAQCDRWRDGCHDCPQKRGYPASLLRDQSTRNYADKRRLFSAVPRLTLVTPSRWLAGLTRESFLRGKDVRVLPNGIDLAVFHPVESDLRARYGLRDKTLLLGVALVWDARKGLDSFLALRKRLPERYAIVLIGLTEKQIRALPAGILGLPRTRNASELAAWYSTADVYVDCTHEENFPTTHLEALACGAPVATFAAGGSAEMLTEACGFGVPVGDIDGLLGAVDRALALDRAACVARAAAYSEEARLAAYVALYDEVCK